MAVRVRMSRAIMVVRRVGAALLAGMVESMIDVFD